MPQTGTNMRSSVRGRTTAGYVLAILAMVGTTMLTSCAGSDAVSPGDPVGEPNGVEELSADEILDRVQEAVDAASSVYVVGDGSSGESTVSIDMRLTSAGDAVGSLTNDGQQVQIVVADGVTYFAADEAFWTGQAGPEAAAEIGDSYVEVPPEQDTFGGVANYASFFGDLLDPEGEPKVGEETTVDDARVIELIDTKDGGIMYVALDGEPLPLKVTPEEGGEVTFTEWNESVTVEAPAADEIFDVESLAP